MSCDRRVTDERHFLARIEEPHPHVVVRPRRRKHESDLGMRELTRESAQGELALSIGIEHHARRVAGETSAREGIDLKNSQGTPLRPLAGGLPGAVLHAAAWQATLPANLGVVLEGPETRDIDRRYLANPLNLTRLVPA